MSLNSLASNLAASPTPYVGTISITCTSAICPGNTAQTVNDTPPDRDRFVAGHRRARPADRDDAAALVFRDIHARGGFQSAGPDPEYRRRLAFVQRRRLQRVLVRGDKFSRNPGRGSAGNHHHHRRSHRTHAWLLPHHARHPILRRGSLCPGHAPDRAGVANTARALRYAV